MPGDPLRIVIAPPHPVAGPPGGREELGPTRATHRRLPLYLGHAMACLANLAPVSASYDGYLFRIWRKAGPGETLGESPGVLVGR